MVTLSLQFTSEHNPNQQTQFRINPYLIKLLVIQGEGTKSLQISIKFKIILV